MEDESTRRLRATFHAIDRNGDGEICVGELEDALQKMPIELSRVRLQRRAASKPSLATAPAPRLPRKRLTPLGSMQA